jgi:hypothetical protein
MIKKSVDQYRFGKLRFVLVITTACTVFGAGCTPDQANETDTTLAGDLVRQLVAWWLL